MIFSPNDLIAYNYYLEELDEVSLDTTSLSLNDELYEQNILGWTTSQVVIFYDILRQSSSNKQFEEIYRDYSNENYQSRVIKDESTNSIALFEICHLTNSILILLNGDEYILCLKGLDLYIIDSNNNEIAISKTTALNNEVSTLSLKDTPYTSNDDNLYTSDIGPYNSQNQSLVEFIDYVSEAAGIVSANHPVLGYVEFVVTGHSLVMGESQYFTSYIKYWQANKKTDLSFVRQKERWFSDSSCADKYYIDNYTRYYDTARP